LWRWGFDGSCLGLALITARESQTCAAKDNQNSAFHNDSSVAISKCLVRWWLACTQSNACSLNMTAPQS
jgi:hypothetical protein